MTCEFAMVELLVHRNMGAPQDEWSCGWYHWNDWTAMVLWITGVPGEEPQYKCGSPDINRIDGLRTNHWTILNEWSVLSSLFVAGQSELLTDWRCRCAGSRTKFIEWMIVRRTRGAKFFVQIKICDHEREFVGVFWILPTERDSTREQLILLTAMATARSGTGSMRLEQFGWAYVVYWMKKHQPVSWSMGFGCDRKSTGNRVLVVFCGALYSVVRCDWQE